MTALGLSPEIIDALRHATPQQIERAAAFPRALFRLDFPKPGDVGRTAESGSAAVERSESGSRAQVLRLVLLHSARNLSRISGYWARLLLCLDDEAVSRLRSAGVDEIVSLSLSGDLLGAAFGAADWIWRELLTEARPEYRRRLLLIGFQPDVAPASVPGLA